MKKIFLIAFAAMSMAAMAQQVTPVALQITEAKLDSLRTLYIQEPPMYRASLDMLAEQLKADENALKNLKNELKAEQQHSKDIAATLKDASKMVASLKKLYAKEESELKSMQSVVEKQQKGISKKKELNEQTREQYSKLLESQQKELSVSLRDVVDRQRGVADLEPELQRAQADLLTYNQQIERKAMDVAQLEAQLKERKALVKAEQKAAKSLQ